jgi:hypothetical protein
VPLDDPRQVRSLDDAFDLSTPEVQLWELHLVWRALSLGLLRTRSSRAARITYSAADAVIPRV